MRTVNFFIHDKRIELELEGNTYAGTSDVLVKHDEDLSEYTNWKDVGYTISNFLDKQDFERVKQGLCDMIADKIIAVGGAIDHTFCLENYHHYVDDALHMKVAKSIQWGWPVNTFPIDFDKVNRRISEELNIQVSTKAKHVDFNNFFLRIVRPQNFQDNNPPHRDVWLDRLRDAMNIYVPIAGSNENSSLGLMAGSHLLREDQIERTSEGAILNGTSYTVPCVISVKGEEPRLIRPNPQENEVLIFSPYLIHGGGYNFNTDTTRVSLEVRFWKVSN